VRGAEALARLQSGGSERRERSRKSKTSSPPASDEAIDEQR
jgi:hypothetical protein